MSVRFLFISEKNTKSSNTFEIESFIDLIKQLLSIATKHYIKRSKDNIMFNLGDVFRYNSK